MKRFGCLLALVLALGCTGEGKVQLSFQISGSFVVPDDAWLHITVRERDGAVLGGDVVAVSDGRASLSIRNGENRVAVVEVRDGADPATARVLGYGISEPFTIAAGEDSVAAVPVDVSAVASVLSLTIEEARDGFVRTPDVQLNVVSSRPDIASVVVAQDPGLSLGRSEVEVAGGDTFSVPYDLDAACRDVGACVDGPRSVVVQLEDAAGYPSDRAVVVVQRDIDAPAVVPGTTTLQLEAPGDFVEVTRADDGVEVRISFSLTEAVSSTPTLSLADSALPFELAARVRTTWVYSRIVGPEDPVGPQQPVLTATDLAGNEAVIQLDAAYDVERRVPDPPDVQTPGRIVYRRAPWGVPGSSSATFEVVGQAGAVTPFAFVHIYDDAQVFDGNELVGVRVGQTQADENGAFVAPLVPVDRLAVYVLVISASGSLHGRDAALVQNVQWIAPATAPSNSPPPIRTVTRASLDDDLIFEGPGIDDVFDVSALTSTGAGVVTVDAPFGYTQHLPVGSPAPDARRFSGVAYDTVRGRAVVVGGRSAGDLVQRDVWEWNGSAWQRGGDPAGFPRCEDGTAFGDDPFGYTTFAGHVSQTVVICRTLDPVAPPPLQEDDVDELVAFGWNGQTWSSVPLTADGDAPVGRVGHAVTYDPKRRRVVMFGGNTGTLQVAGPDVPGFRETLGDTWELEAVLASADEPAGLAWVRVTPTGPTPPPRDRASMIYDPSTERVLLFGGIGTDRQPLDDLWAWDGTSWSEATRTTPWPPARAGHAMVFDPRSQQVAVVAGTDVEPRARQLRQQDPGRSDTWWFDGSGWTQMPGASPTGIAPVVVPQQNGPPIALSEAPFDVQDVLPAESWALTPRGRRDRTPSTTAPSTGPTFAATAYDTVNHELILVQEITGGTWRWSPSGWRLRSDTAPPFGQTQVVYDPGRELVGSWGRGFPLEPAFFFALTETATTWQLVSPAVRPRSTDLINEPLLAAYDPMRGGIVTFVAPRTGGYEMWSFDGAAWTRFDQGATNLTLRVDAIQMISVGPGMFIIDGSDNAYRYDGSFTAIAPAPGFGRHAYDSDRDRVMSFREGGGYQLDDAGAWQPITVADAPVPAGVNPAPIHHHYDPATRSFFTSLGSPAGEPPGAVYELDVDASVRPGVVASVDLAGARIVAATVTGVSAAVVAGGSGPGYEVVLYDPGRAEWTGIATSAATPNAPASLDATTSGDVIDFVLSRPDRVAVGVTTVGRRGRGSVPPTLVVDQLSIAIDYRLTP